MPVMHAIIRGRVQGVGFRAFAARLARSFGLRGFVRNLADGSVELVAAGEAFQLRELTSRLRQGPPTAAVESLELTELPDLPADSGGFEVLRV